MGLPNCKSGVIVKPCSETLPITIPITVPEALKRALPKTVPAKAKGNKKRGITPIKKNDSAG